MIDKSGAEGAWIFVSHSHLDLEKVRRIRNALEERGHNPLLFFLKCLGDDSEVDDLIRREIEARTWFVLCDSPNARASRWVQAETEIIKSLEGKVFVVIDLDQAVDEQLREIDRISKRATVFMSYARADEGIARSIVSALRAQDYAVFDVEALRPGEDWAGVVEDRIRGATATEEGFFLVVLSPDAVRSDFVRQELRVALDAAEAGGRSTNIVPVVVRDYDATVGLLGAYPETRYLLYEVGVWDVTMGDLDRRISQLIDDLKTRFMGEDLERLAEGFHVAYCAGMLEQGYGWSAPSDEYLLRHPLLRSFAGRDSHRARVLPFLVPYEVLPEDLKEQNREMARKIPRILSAGGYSVLPAKSGDRLVEFPEDIVELLAEREHERWVWTKLSAGWCYGPERDDSARRHPALVPWRTQSEQQRQTRYGAYAACVGDVELPAEEKQRDREFIRIFPRCLAAARYTAVRNPSLQAS